MLKVTLPAVYTRCAEPSDSIVWDERRELTIYTQMGRGAQALYHKGISVHWDESSGLPPIIQVSSKVFPGRPTNALIICVHTTIVKGCGLPFSCKQ